MTAPQSWTTPIVGATAAWRRRLNDTFELLSGIRESSTQQELCRSLWPATALVRARFELGSETASCGLALVADANLEGWFVTLDLKRGIASLAYEPRPLDDFWADLTVRKGAYREIDGPVVAQCPIDVAARSHQVVVLVEDEILEVYIDERAALTHRTSREAPLRPCGFVVDGEVEFELEVSQQA